MDEPLISIVIPVTEGAYPVRGTLDKVLRQVYEPKEVIICGTTRSNQIPAASASGEVKVITTEPEMRFSALLNTAFQTARGEIMLLLRPECEPAGSEWLSQMAAPFEDRQVAAVVSQCRMEDKRSTAMPARLLNSVAPVERISSSKTPTPQELVSHLCDAYRAEVLEEIGCFGNGNYATPGEAVDASIKISRAGHSIVLAPDATVYYRPAEADQRLGPVLRRAIDYGFSDALLSKVHQVDWLGSRIYGAAALSLLLVPMGLAYLPSAFILAGVLFIWGWFLSLKLPLLRCEWPVAFLNAALYVGMVLWVRDDWAAGLIGRKTHPAIIRQWCFLFATTGTYVLLLSKATGASTFRSLVRDRSLVSLPAILFLSMIWRLLSGVGYFAGFVANMLREY